MSSEDVIMAIFSTMKKKSVPKDHSVIQKAIFKLKQTPEYKEVLNDFTFDKSGLTPYSKQLEEILTRLETFCIFGTLNPKYDTYNLNMEFLRRGYNRISSDMKQVIEKMGEIFESLINECGPIYR